MGHLSDVFHVVSLLGLVALIVLVLRLQMIIKTWRDWASPAASRRVVVAEPLRILRVFACAIGASFDTDVPIDALPPCKIILSGLFEIHRQRGITGISVKIGEPPVVGFILEQETSTMTTDLSRISRELGGSLRVELDQAHC